MVLFNHKKENIRSDFGGIKLTERLFEYLGSQTVFSLYCGVGDIMIKLNNIEIIDIVREGCNIRVYFDEENYLYINPEGYKQHESCRSKYIKDNGDYLLFIEENEVLI